jgi:hypothetical protein
MFCGKFLMVKYWQFANVYEATVYAKLSAAGLYWALVLTMPQSACQRLKAFAMRRCGKGKYFGAKFLAISVYLPIWAKRK